MVWFIIFSFNLWLCIIHLFDLWFVECPWESSVYVGRWEGSFVTAVKTTGQGHWPRTPKTACSGQTQNGQKEDAEGGEIWFCCLGSKTG